MCIFDPPPQPAAAPVVSNDPVPAMKSPEDQNKDTSTGAVRSAALARRQLRMDIPTGSSGSTGAGLNVPM